MSLDAILAAIREQGQAGVRAIEQRTDAAVAQIIADAEREAAQIEQAARAAASRATAADRARILHGARLEAMQIVGGAEQAIVRHALDRVQGRLAALRDTPDYPDLLRRLADEAITALHGSLREGELAHLHADPRDRALLEDVLGDMGLDLPVSYALETWGGVRATSADLCVVVDNTLEARLRSATPHLQRRLPTLLPTQQNTGEQPARRAAFDQVNST